MLCSDRLSCNHIISRDRSTYLCASYGWEQLGNTFTVSELVPLSAVSTVPPCPAHAIPALPKSSEHLLGDEPWQVWWHGDTENVLAQGVLLVARKVKQSLPPCMCMPDNFWSTNPARSSQGSWGCLAWRGGGSGGISPLSKQPERRLYCSQKGLASFPNNQL